MPWEVRRGLDDADEWELYSLRPVQPRSFKGESFHGWPVLGKTTIKDPDTRKRLRAALARGANLISQGLPGPMCFNPRHGIRATHGDQTIDLLICFECEQVEAHGAMDYYFHIMGSQQEPFDAVLKEAGVPLPRPGSPIESLSPEERNEIFSPKERN
jgi:hypothetical protein